MSQGQPLMPPRTTVIPGIPPDAAGKLLKLLSSNPAVTALWLYGSRAMGRQRPGSDIDLCLEGPELTHNDRLRLLAQVDDLLLPWQVDLSLKRELPGELLEHIARVGICLWRRTHTGATM